MIHLSFRYPLRAAALAFAAASMAFAEPAAVLKNGTTVTISDSSGKFDFLKIDSARRRLLASHEKDETADIIDLEANRVVARLKLGPVVDVAVDTQAGKYYYSVQDDKRIAIVDTSSLKETGSIALEGECDAILFDAKSRRLYVAHDNGTHLWVADVDAAKVVTAIEIPGAPECMVHDASAGKIYLNIKATSEVVVIDTAANKLVAHWPTAPATAPHGLAFDAAHGRLYSAGDNGLLAILDTGTGKVIGTVSITEKVDQAAIDAKAGLVYCAGAGWLSVVKVSASGATLLGNVKTAETAKNVAVDPKTHAVWSTYTDGKNSYAQSWLQP